MIVGGLSLMIGVIGCLLGAGLSLMIGDRVITNDSTLIS